jgi:magnesium transporter
VRDLHRVASSQAHSFGIAHEAILALPGFEKSTKPYLRDIGDHLHQIADEFQRQTEDLFSLTQTYYNANADRLNATATRITIGGTIFVVWTVITGFFGMNFGWLVDGINSRHDFLLYGIGGITVPTVILLTLFWVKRRDWF